MAQSATNGQTWDLAADVVVIGSGAAGLPAAIKAADGGASVIVVETQLRHRRARDHQRRQCAAWRRHQRAKKVRHSGLTGYGLFRPDRLDHRAS